jgi:hypothetical protein
VEHDGDLISDSESVSTNANNTELSQRGVPGTQTPNRTTQNLTCVHPFFQPPNTTSKDALDDQALARILYDLDCAKLLTLEHFLEDIHIKPEMMPHALNLHDRFVSLSAQLKQRIKTSTTNVLSSDAVLLPISAPPSTNLSPAHTSHLRKRWRTEILPPSPEKKRKRKKSYGIH